MAFSNRKSTNTISPVVARTAGTAICKPASYVVDRDAPAISTTADDGLDEASTDETIGASINIGESEPCDSDATNGTTGRTEDERAGITVPWAFAHRDFDELFARSDDQRESSGRADKLGTQSLKRCHINVKLPRFQDHPDNNICTDDDLAEEDAACDRYHWPSVEGILRDDDPWDMRQFARSQFMPGLFASEARQMPPVLTRSDSARQTEEVRNVLDMQSPVTVTCHNNVRASAGTVAQ